MSDVKTAPGREYRTVPFAVEERTESPGGFKGTAAVFERMALIGDRSWGFVEVIKRGAFDDVLQNDVRFLHNHDPNRLLARTTNGTLRLSTNRSGLEVSADMADTSYGRDIAVLLARKDVHEMSFGFNIGMDEYGKRNEDWFLIKDAASEFDGLPLRVINRFSALFDVSTVTFPAYPATAASLRSMVDAAKEALGPVVPGAAARGKISSGTPNDWTATHERALRHLAHKEGNI